MRTLVDIPDADLARPNLISESKNISRAEVVRRAITGYLAQHKPSGSGIDEAFGLWADRNEDGLAYQERIRRQWDRVAEPNTLPPRGSSHVPVRRRNL